MSYRRSKLPFKSPLASRSTAQTTQSKEEQVKKLQQDIADLDKEIEELKEQGYKEEELKGFMEQLHDYNDIKDTTQIVLGKLAEVKGTTVKEMHQKYGLDMSE